MKVVCVLIVILYSVLNSVQGEVAFNKSKNEVEKPFGVFSSKITPKSAAHPLCKGLLIRTSWSALEPVKDKFDFSDIDKQIEMADRSGRKNITFSLAVSAGLGGSSSGPNFPSWLLKEGVKTMPIQFRRKEGVIPKMWDPIFQKRLKKLADALSKKFAKEKRLKLVYVPQATANGIEGHFNGTSYESLRKNGLTEEKWVSSVKEAAISFADAFQHCAIAIEVHEILGSSKIPMKILNDLYKHPKYGSRIGAGMWWISGGVKYQPSLVDALKKYQGDIYGQVIGNSSQPYRFGDKSEDYRKVFHQAIDLNVRYLEVWNFEFDFNTQNGNIEKFNKFALDKYETGVSDLIIPNFEKPKETERKTRRPPRRLGK